MPWLWRMDGDVADFAGCMGTVSCVSVDCGLVVKTDLWCAWRREWVEERKFMRYGDLDISKSLGINDDDRFTERMMNIRIGHFLQL